MLTTDWKPHWTFHHTGEAYSRYRFHGLIEQVHEAILIETII